MFIKKGLQDMSWNIKYSKTKKTTQTNRTKQKTVAKTVVININNTNDVTCIFINSVKIWL